HADLALARPYGLQLPTRAGGERCQVDREGREQHARSLRHGRGAQKKGGCGGDTSRRASPTPQPHLRPPCHGHSAGDRVETSKSTCAWCTGGSTVFPQMSPARPSGAEASSVAFRRDPWAMWVYDPATLEMLDVHDAAL